MGALDSVKESFSGKGKFWILGGAVLAGGYLWWSRVRTTGASDRSGAATITEGGAAVADPVTPPGGDYSPASTTERPTNNGEWLSQAVAILILPPYNRPSAATFNSLSKALAGSPLTTAEGAIVELAIQVKGTPPEGMPPLNISAPGPSGGTDSTPPASGLTTPSGLRSSGQRKNWISLACGTVTDADGYRFYQSHLAKYTDVAGPAMDWWVENKTAPYTFAVAARKGGEVSAPSSFITVNYTAK